MRCVRLARLRAAAAGLCLALCLALAGTVQASPAPVQPRPMKGILVAMMVMNWMFVASGNSAMWTTASATC